MSFTKWRATRWDDDEPIECSFKKETQHFYIRLDGRRESKTSKWSWYFDTRQQALDFIEQRKSKKDEQKRLDQIRSVAPELLEALELILRKYEAQADCAELDTDGAAVAAARAVIAKARGES